MNKCTIVLMMWSCCAMHLLSQSIGERNDLAHFLNDTRVDSIYHQLTPDERIAQLFWLMTENLHNPQSVQHMLNLVDKWQPGGILYMKNNASDIARFSNLASAKSKVPLIFSIDGENGLALRMKGITPLPKAMTLGAIQDEQLLYRVGGEMARQFHRMGLQVNFAPVADVNSNAANPVIGSRSFGENPLVVARQSVAIMRGMQDGGIVAVAKHFPGHGDTDTDSHLALPMISHSRARMDSVELVPFDALIKNGVMGVMSAHLEVTSLDTTRGVPASLSKPILTGLLKHGMGFHGVVITDAMNMQGVKKAGSPGRVDAMALMAGNDIVESTENIGAAIEAVKLAIVNGELTWDDIEHKCRKSLALKLWAQCDSFRMVKEDSVIEEINASMDVDLLKQLYEQSLTVLMRAQDSLRLERNGSNTALALVLPGASALADSIGAYRALKQLKINIGSGHESIQQNLAIHQEIIVCMGSYAESRKVWNDKALSTLWSAIFKHPDVTIVFGGSPYQLDKLRNVDTAREIVLVYEPSDYAWRAAALYLAGMLEAKGKLPVSIGAKWPMNAGWEGKR